VNGDRRCGQCACTGNMETPGEKSPGLSYVARYLGRVHGYSPGCFSTHANPLHDESGSVGGPHHGTRSEHQYSPVRRSKTNKKPMSIKTADVIASAITKRLLVVVTEATYVAVAGVSGSL
jgi:hypothetical protein